MYASVQEHLLCSPGDQPQAALFVRGNAQPIRRIAGLSSRPRSASACILRARCRWEGLPNELDGFPLRPVRSCFPRRAPEAERHGTAADGRASGMQADRPPEDLLKAPHAEAEWGRFLRRGTEYVERSRWRHLATCHATSAEGGLNDNREPRQDRWVCSA